MTWQRTRLKRLCRDSGQYGFNTPAESYSESGVRLLRTSDIREDGTLRPPEDGVFVDAIPDGRFLLQAGDLLLSRSGTIGRGFLVPELDRPTTFAGFLVRFRPLNEVEPRYMSYVASSRPFQAAVAADAVTNTIQNFNAERYANIELSVPELPEQRRTADFLDAETARIDRLTDLRGDQSRALQERSQAAIDETLTQLGAKHPTVPARRVLSVMPGYSFPSEAFTSNEDDVRLLRGINVGVQGTRWDDVVYWPASDQALVRRFQLVPGDVVMGMDRPWISGGMRIARMSNADLPALLLQRVAVLRAGPRVDMGFVYWCYQMTNFRVEVEGMLTGTSVPHLSGDQIASFAFPLPPLSEQSQVAARLTDVASRNAEARGGLDASIALLLERRQALITAAVTGQLDVTTAQGAA